MKITATWKWVALALAGLLIAGAVAVAASRLASEQIGIASESVSAGDQLAPAVRQAAIQTSSSPKPQRQPAEPESTTGTTESDDHGGDDDGSDGHGGDDHGGEDHSGHGGGGDDD